MKDEQKKLYLDKWGTECFICKQEVPRKDKSLVKSIIELERYPEHADPTIIKYYMACPECVKEGMLI